MRKLIRKIVAKARGTFVADCPKCHQHFYGKNAYESHVHMEGKNYRFVCHRCCIELKERKAVL